MDKHLMETVILKRIWNNTHTLRYKMCSLIVRFALYMFQDDNLLQQKLQPLLPFSPTGWLMVLE